MQFAIQNLVLWPYYFTAKMLFVIRGIRIDSCDQRKYNNIFCQLPVNNYITKQTKENTHHITINTCTCTCMLGFLFISEPSPVEYVVAHTNQGDMSTIDITWDKPSGTWDQFVITCLLTAPENFPATRGRSTRLTVNDTINCKWQ